MNGFVKFVLAGSVSLISLCSVANAQSYYGRQQLSTRAVPNPNPTPTPTPTPGPAQNGSWVPSSWSAWSSQCSDTATRVRSVECRYAGAVVPDAQCGGGRPASSETSQILDGCTFQWKTGAWSEPSSYCAPDATETRTVQCIRHTGETAPDASCVAGGQGPRPAAVQTVAAFSSCQYEARNWTTPTYSSTCSATAVKSQIAQCVRLDAYQTVTTETECNQAGVSTVRNTVEPNYSGCSYSWKTGNWSAWSNACSPTASRTRSVTCERSDTTAVADGECVAVGAKPAASESGNYAGCGYSWVSTYGAWSAQCDSNATRAVTSTCTRSDGQAVADAQCTGSKPAALERGNTSGCEILPAASGTMDQQSGWTGTQGVTYGIGPNGTPSAKLTGQVYPNVAFLYKNFDVVAGKRYTVSVQYIGAAGSPCTNSNNVSPTAIWKYANGYGAGSTGAFIYEAMVVCAGGVYNKSYSFVADYTGGTQVMIWIEANAGQTATVWVDNVVINQVP